mmetsp:Transcript_48673/g.54216  ORF Transcript_48673/g.54216 Transcript_48673/m.54216 type:complete len:104 (+) Transcript_48673:288-599(+)
MSMSMSMSYHGKPEHQDEDEGKRYGIKDLLCKTTHEELLKPYEFVVIPLYPPLHHPYQRVGLRRIGHPTRKHLPMTIAVRILPTNKREVVAPKKILMIWRVDS